MISIEKISNFSSEFGKAIYQNTQEAFEDLYKQIRCFQLEQPQQQLLEKEHNQIDHSQSANQKGQLLPIYNIESLSANQRAHTQEATKTHSSQKRRRIKQIEEEKRKIAEELSQLDRQIETIKGKNNNENAYKKRQKINKDQNAQKNAELLVKQLKQQRKQIENRKKLQLQKSLQQMQKEDEQRRKKRQQEALRVKQQRRLAIAQRMQQQKKRRQQRKLIQMQSNQLITKLKKQEQLQKVVSLAPSQIMQVDHQKKMLQKKNNFDFRQIQEHDRKYRQLKQKAKREKQERSKSLKVHTQENTQKFARNVWIERIQQQENRKKQEQRQLSERKKIQLQKRMKYGELVKNIFLPKKKQKQNDSISVPIEQKKQEDQQQSALPKTQSKPRTPQQSTALPKIKQSKSIAKNNKFSNVQSAQQMKNGRKIKIQKKKSLKQFDADEQEKQKIRKIRQLQLRKQTKQRLKKIQNQHPIKPEMIDQKKKYKNYLSEVKVKKSESTEWKKIIDDDRLTEQQKYQQLMRKAQKLQAKAKLKEDKNYLRETNQDAVNLYIGSIQAKLALLQKF